ncbi:MAG TPA: zinc-dependent metalloprotease [Solirubrobacteraceae bacterium]|nr:zinc-dependent metalloprotease [Solirubrobacteraceae bacterium]
MIDWIIAQRIATFVAGTGDAPAPEADLAALAAESESRVVAYTGLTPSRPLPPPEGISRREWVTSNIDSMRLLLDPVLQRAGDSMGPLKPAMEIGMGFVLSTEVGVVVGYLAQRVLGQYELVLLDEAVEDRPPRLLFVLPNLGQAVQAFGAEEQEFITWVALHEVTHAVQFAGVPWLHPYVAGLVRELLKSAEVHLEAPRKLRIPSTDEVKRVLGHLRNGDLISIVTTTPERETLDRVQAVMAVIEGHAEHVMDVVAPDLLPSLPKLRAALDRRRRSQSGLSRLVAKLLGLELKLRQYEQGKFFCDAIVRERGPAALHHLWSSPDVLPTLPELRNPDAWLERTMPHQLREASSPDAAA